jgi:hypothetical protein
MLTPVLAISGTVSVSIITNVIYKSADINKPNVYVHTVIVHPVYDDIFFLKKKEHSFLQSADFYTICMTFVIMLTNTILDMARSGISMRYFSPRYRKKDQKKRTSTPRAGGGGGGGVLAGGHVVQIN